MHGIAPTRYGWQFLKPKHYVKANQFHPQSDPRILLNRKWLRDTAIQSPSLIRTQPPHSDGIPFATGGGAKP